VKFDRLRQSNRLEEPGFSSDGHVRLVSALLGFQAKCPGRRFQRPDQVDQLSGRGSGAQRHDLRPFPEIDALESEFYGRTSDSAGGSLQCRYVLFRKSADEYERNVPVVACGPLAGESRFIRLYGGVNLSPLFPRRPEGEEYSLAAGFNRHEVVRGHPAAQ